MLQIKKNFRLKKKRGKNNPFKNKRYRLRSSIRSRRKRPTSEEFSKFIDRCGVTGNSNITFVIGGSLGLSDEVRKESKL